MDPVTMSSRGDKGLVLVAIPLNRKWESCVNLGSQEPAPVDHCIGDQVADNIIQTLASTRGEELTAELWLFVSYDNQEIRLFHSTITADLCMAGLHDRTEAGNMKMTSCVGPNLFHRAESDWGVRVSTHVQHRAR